MNFEKIPPVEQCSDILDTAFRKARVKGKQKKLAGNWLQIIRKKESLKLDIVKDTIDNSLQKILTSFPDLNGFPQFYLKLMALTLDLAELKKALGSIKWVQQKNRELHRKFISLINRETQREIIKNINKQYYGRISSLLKQISHQLRYLETCRKVMRSYPDIKEMFTVCIYGFPNVGKTTLLNKLTQTKAKVAAYPFTTKSINAGYLTVNGTQIQVLDVPGTLAREKLNPIERQAELVLKELADLIIYVYDLTESCGYSVEQQQKLQQKLAGREVIIYASKEDLLTESERRKLRSKLYSIEQIEAEIAERL